MGDISLNIKGVLEDQTAVIGSLSHNGVDRPVLIMLNRAKTDYQKKKAVQLAKKSAQESYVPLAGELGRVVN